MLIRTLYSNYRGLTIRVGGQYLLWISLGYCAQVQFSIVKYSRIHWPKRTHRLAEYQLGPLRLLHTRS